MKIFRFILLIVLISLCTISCRKTSDQEKQDVLEDINDALEPMNKTIKDLTPKKNIESEDEMIQKEINKLQDSISTQSLEN